MRTELSAGYWNSAELRDLGFARVGESVRISRLCEIVGQENIEVGDHSRVDAFCKIIASGPVRIGRHVHIASGCRLLGRGGFEMEDFSGLSDDVKIYSASDDYSGRHMTNPTVPETHTGVKVSPVHLGRHVIIGAGSVILPGVRIGEGAAVGALAMVRKSLAEWGIYAGNPARWVAARRRDLLAAEAILMSERRPIVTVDPVGPEPLAAGVKVGLRERNHSDLSVGRDLEGPVSRRRAHRNIGSAAGARA